MRGREVGTQMGGLSSRNLLLAILLLLVLPGLPPASGEEAPGVGDGPHSHFRDPAGCGRCHLSREGRLEPNRFLPGTDELCLGCHSLEGLGVTHPRDVKPAAARRPMAVPGDFPLDTDGKIFCLTCHTAHGPFLSPTRAYANQEAERAGAPAGVGAAFRTYFARRSDPVRGFLPMCEGCHENR